MKKKLFSVALCCLATASVFSLASCGGDSVENAGEEFKVIGLDSLKGDSKVTVEFWHSFGDAVSNALNILLEGDEENDIKGFDDWCTENGYNIEVKVTNKGGGYDGLRKAVNMGAESNAVPTLVLGYPDHFADYSKQKMLLSLDDYVNASDANIALEGGSADFISTYWQEVQMDVDGNGTKETAGVPFNKSTEIMCYNSNMVDPILQKLEQDMPDIFPAGTYNTTTGAWDNPTWDQVAAVSKYIKDNKSTLKYTYNNAEYSIDADMKYPTYIDSESNFFITTSRQWGGEGAYTTEDGTVTANNQYTRAAMTYFKDKADKGLINLPAAGGTGSYGSSYMNVGKAFISIGSTAGVKNNASQRYEMKATTVPQKSYGSDAHNAVIQQGTNLAILTPNSNNKTRLAAWLLIKWLTNTDNQVIFSKNTGYIPVRKSSQESADFAELLKAADKSNKIAYTYNGAVARGLVAAFAEQKYFYTDPAFNGSSIVRDAIGDAVNDIFLYKKSYDDAMATLYTTCSKYRIKTK